MAENPYEPPREVNGASDVRFPAVWHILRFLLPATGAFLLGVYPGMYLLMRFIATRRHWTSGAETIFLVALLASFGATSGLAVFRLTWANLPCNARFHDWELYAQQVEA